MSYELPALLLVLLLLTNMHHLSSLFRRPISTPAQTPQQAPTTATAEPPPESPIRQIKVVVMTPTLGLGGAEQWIRMLVTLSDPTHIRFSVVLLSANSSHPEVINAVSSRADVHSVGPGVAAAVTCHPTLKAAIDAACQDADLVLAWGGGDYWKLLPAIPKVMVAHGTCYYTHLVVEQAIAGGCTHLCAVSQLSADTLLDLSLPCKVLWNGADESRLQVTLPRDHVQHHVWKCQAEWWFKDIIIVGYLGRLAIEKNVLAAAQAVHSLPWQYKCVLIGTGMAAKEITEQARSMLGKRLTVVPPVDDVGNHYAAFDMVVQASHREGNSLSLIEAMLCGVPIVTTRVGAVAEFEEAAGRELFWSLPDHPTANELAAVVRTVGLQGRNDPRVKAAKEFALAHLTGRKMADNWTEYLQSLV